MLACFGCSTLPPAASQANIPEVAPTLELRPIVRIPHDSTASTQGLFFLDGFLFESTGGYGTSTLRRIPIDEPGPPTIVGISNLFFGEGIAHLDGRIYMLTWREGTALVYDVATLRQLETFRYPGEGWGLTTDGSSLIVSDGTSRLRFFDPSTFAMTSVLDVRDGEHPVVNLNELEWIDGEIWANIWFRNRIAVIDPVSGLVRHWLDLEPFLPPGHHQGSAAVPNGIAYDARTGRIFITGKLWPWIHVVEVGDTP